MLLDDVIANVFVVGVITTYNTEADVFSCYITLLLDDVIANVFVVGVITTYNTEADVFACYITLLLADVIAKTYVVDVMSTYCNMRRYYLADVIAIYFCGRCYNH